MGYDLHITRKPEWFGDGPTISLSEWLCVIDADPDMRLDGFAQAPLPDGRTLRVEEEGLAVWTAYSKHGADDSMAWFSYGDGNISVKNPDQEIIGKMCSLAERLGASVQGDDGEFYPQPPKRPWWRRWPA